MSAPSGLASDAEVARPSPGSRGAPGSPGERVGPRAMPTASVGQRISRVTGPWLALGVGLVALVLASAYMLGRGPAPVHLADLADWFRGTASPPVAAVIEGSRLPRWEAGIFAGAALGAAGVLLQGATRNPLAEPGLLGIGAGAQVALAVVAITGWDAAGYPRGFVALAGALVAAALTFLVASSTGAGPARLILAGTAVALLFGSVAATLQLVDEQATAGLFFWGQGSLAPSTSARLFSALPFLVAGAALAVALSRRLDLLALGDQRSTAMGATAGRTRLFATLAGVLLTAAAVTVTGPIGFVGLLAPHAARALGARRHAALLPASALLGAALVLVADGLTREVGRAAGLGELPVGVLTALVGAPFLLLLAWRVAGGAPPRDVGHLDVGHVPFPAAMAGTLVAAVLVWLACLCLGSRSVSPADLAAVLTGGGSDGLRSVVVDGRLPRSVVAAAAGAALAVAGCLLQGVTRNPLAAPSTLGIVAGGTAGALTLALAFPAAPIELMPWAAFVGAVIAIGVVLLVARTGDPNRLVLVGVAVTAFATAIVSLVVVSHQLRLAQALSWLSGSTYGRGWSDLVVLAPFLVVLIPLAWTLGRRADLLAIDDDVAAALGVRPRRTRLVLIGVATLLAAAAVSVVGAIAFIGLIAPQLARLVSGPVHRRSILLSAVVGATLLVVADALGRWVLAPRELPAGLVVALLGTPVFLGLLLATRRHTADER